MARRDGTSAFDPAVIVTPVANGVSDDFAAAVLATILPHVGFDNCIKRSDLLAKLYARGYGCVDLDRKMRIAIHDLRNQGQDIITNPAGSGYCMCGAADEAIAWAERKMLPSARDQFATVRAVMQTVQRKYPMKQLAMDNILRETARPGLPIIVT
jgi:hypothetical protein